MRALLPLAFLLAPAVAVAQPADPAVARVEAYQAAIRGVLKDGAAAGASGRAARFLPVVREYYDLEGALQLIAGPAWAKASAPEKAAAVSALAERNARLHATSFNGNDPRFTTEGGAVARGADRLVRSRVVGRAGGAGTPIIYRMRQQDGRWQVLDVVSKGVSQVAVQRSDFAGAVSQGGLPGLTARLAELNAKERARG